jgi:DNA recombination protein RmuC
MMVEATPIIHRHSSNCAGGSEYGDARLWLPIDAQFPHEDYEKPVDASERGDVEAAESASKAVEMRIHSSAKEICKKYVHPPHSTDFAVLFLPTEGLFAEIIRRPGLVDALQRDCRIVVTGPTTLMALLNSLRMGFSHLGHSKTSSRHWWYSLSFKLSSAQPLFGAFEKGHE